MRLVQALFTKELAKLFIIKGGSGACQESCHLGHNLGRLF
jgi:hypothetical protein